MSLDITRVKADMEGALHGTTINQVRNVYGIFNRAARDVLADCDPAETKRSVALPVIYPEVYDYACPADLKGDRIIDIRPQFNRRLADRPSQTYNQEFDLLKSKIRDGELVTVKWDTGLKTLRIAADPTGSTLLHDCDTITGNGTWATTGSGGGIVVDSLNYVQGVASLKWALGNFVLAIETDGYFLLEDGVTYLDVSTTPGSVGYIENSTFSPADLSAMAEEGAIFCYLYLPNITDAVSVKLRWGSSALDYWEKTVTTAFDSTAFVTGWNMLKFDWQTATMTGSPVNTAINYLQFGLTPVTFPLYPVRVDAFFASLGSIAILDYYSKYMFRDGSTGAFKETVTADTDLINLDTDSYQVFFNRVMYLASQQMQGSDALAYDSQFFLTEYEKSLKRYQAKYKSEVQKPQSTYYSKPRAGYTRYMGTRRIF
jgi:hypothetical protein